MTTFFTADTHWGHQSILRLANRPFASLEEMNEAMITRWNRAVQPRDTVYHLGDVAFRMPPGWFPAVFARLNGEKHLLRGNHDNAEVLAQPWASISDIRELRLDGARIVLCHYPMRSWTGMYKGHWHFYGHEHANLADHANTMDVGVDNWHFYPVSLATIRARMTHLTPWAARLPTAANSVPAAALADDPESTNPLIQAMFDRMNQHQAE